MVLLTPNSSDAKQKGRGKAGDGYMGGPPLMILYCNFYQAKSV